MTQSTDHTPWIPATEAAAILGVKVERLRRWTRQGKGPRSKRSGESGHNVVYDESATIVYRDTYGPFFTRARNRKEAS